MRGHRSAEPCHSSRTRPNLDTGPRVPGLMVRERSQDAPIYDPHRERLWGAAFRQENTIVSTINYLQEMTGFETEPDHNPLDIIADTDYETRHLSRFVGSRSRAQTHAIMARIDREENDRRILESSGWEGVVASIAAGALDPTLFIPLGAVHRTHRTAQAVGRTMVSGAAVGAAVTAGQEAVLYNTQELRTLGETTDRIAIGAIVGGILGGAVGYASLRELRT